MSILLLAAMACSKNDDTGDTSSETSVFDENIFVTEAPTSASGDPYSCYTPGDAWAQSAADPSCQAEVPLKGQVEDFETGNGVEDPTMVLYWDNAYDASGGDVTVEGDADGNFDGATMKTCQPVAYSVSTDPVLDETVLTIQAHNIFPYAASLDEQFNSVSKSTYNVIPGLLGVTVTPGEGIVAGTVYGCGGDGDPTEFAQVIVSDAATGEYYDGQVIHYFREEFPHREQEWTSDDGLFVAVNIPAGEATVEVYTWSGTEYDLMATTTLTIEPDSINIANTFIGSGGDNGGIVYPESCTTPCTQE